MKIKISEKAECNKFSVSLASTLQDINMSIIFDYMSQGILEKRDMNYDESIRSIAKNATPWLCHSSVHSSISNLIKKGLLDKHSLKNFYAIYVLTAKGERLIKKYGGIYERR